jgi:hypothetical protein
MKRTTHSTLFASLSIALCTGQNILNPSFDSVYFGGIDRVLEWVTSDGIIFAHGAQNDTVLPLQTNAFYDATGFMYSEILWVGNLIDTSPLSFAAVQISSRPNWRKADGSPYEGFVINGNHFYTDSTGYPDLSRCGIPFTSRPTKIKGYYRFTDSTATGNQFGKCIVLLKKWNATTRESDTIAFVNDGTTLNPGATIQPFEIALNYSSTATPDTLMVAFFAASDPESAASLWLDELSLDYTGMGFADRAINQIQIYPIPAKDCLHISTAHIIRELSIYDLLGQEVHAPLSANKIGVTALKNGIYVLRLRTEAGNFQEKIVVQH